MIHVVNTFAAGMLSKFGRKLPDVLVPDRIKICGYAKSYSRFHSSQ